MVLYFFGLDEMSESEGLDRTHMRIPQVQVDVLRAMAKVNPNIVGVISAGSAIEMEWEDSLKAILHGYLTGQAGAGAMLDLLTGRVMRTRRPSRTILQRREIPITERLCLSVIAILTHLTKRSAIPSDTVSPTRLSSTRISRWTTKA